MPENIFFDDDENINCCENERGIFTCSSLPHSAALTLDNILAEKLISDKIKPRQDVLVSLEETENHDPYSEFSFGENEQERKIRSPLKGFAFFSTQTTPVSSKGDRNILSTPYSLSRRLRLLKKYTPQSSKSKNINEEEYISCPPRRSRNFLTPQNDLSLDSTQLDDSTPRRPNLRPRKRAWIDEDSIPLSALRQSLLYHKKEREERAMAEGSDSKKKRRNSKSSTPKSIDTISHANKYSRKIMKKGKSKRKLRFSESDDEGLIDWIKRLKTERKQSASAQNDSRSDILTSSFESKCEENEQ